MTIRHQRISKNKSSRRKFVACLIIALIVAASVLVYARRAGQARADVFAAAADVPRGALVYVQCEDLRELLKTWNESKFKGNYLASQNFKEFAQRHLALRLLERWETANDALGFTLDTNALSGISEGRAGVAMYDIGRLEMVFVAPLSLEKAKATEFFTGHEKFEEVKLPDGTKYFRREISGDKRKPLTIIFTTTQNRFVLATNEGLFLRTLANINKQSAKDRLADEPEFSTLARNAQPHFFTVWVDQQKLNDDAYFRRYWAFANIGDFKNIRAGMFDLERRQDKWIERRDFLREAISTDEATATASLPSTVTRRLARFVPADAPYYRLRAISAPSETSALVTDTLFDRATQNTKRRASVWNWRRYNDSDFDLNTSNESGSRRESRYSNLKDDYDTPIDDPRAARIAESEDADTDATSTRNAKNELMLSIQKSLQPSAPQAAIFIESPQTFAPPLFAEFRRAVVFMLRAPEGFNRTIFENALAKFATSRVLVAGGKSSSEMTWRDTETNGVKMRAMQLPLLNWTLCYALRNQELLIANNTELLQTMLANANTTIPIANDIDARNDAPLDELIVIRFAVRRQAFDALVERLDKPRRRARAEKRAEETKTSSDDDEDDPTDFFSGNIKSLLDAASFIKEIRITRHEQRETLHEVIDFSMN